MAMNLPNSISISVYSNSGEALCSKSMTPCALGGGAYGLLHFFLRSNPTVSLKIQLLFSPSTQPHLPNTEVKLLKRSQGPRSTQPNRYLITKQWFYTFGSPDILDGNCQKKQPRGLTFLVTSWSKTSPSKSREQLPNAGTDRLLAFTSSWKLQSFHPPWWMPKSFFFMVK